jgi:hypothetical protein
VIGEATRLGVTLDVAAAQALVARVGDRQAGCCASSRKLAIEHGAERGSARRSQDAAAVSSLAVGSRRRAGGGRCGERDARSSRCVCRASAATARPAHGQARPRRAGDRRAIRRRRDARADQVEPADEPLRRRHADQRRAAPIPIGCVAPLELLSDLELDIRGGSELAEDAAALLAIDRIVAA